MDKLKIETLLSLWNGWDRFPGGRPFPREEKQETFKRLSVSKSLLIRGCRASGKSTFLRMLAMEFLQRGTTRDSIVFMDLEDPLWTFLPNKAGYFEEVLNKHPKLLLLDGVERIEGWESLVHNSVGRGIVTVASITGNARTVPRGLDVLDLLPLSFSSWMSIYTDKKVDKKDGQIGREYLTKYLNAGGLPVTRQAGGRRQALVDVFYSSLLKDVLLRKRVRAPEILTAMAVYLLKNTGRPISAARMRGYISRSMDQSRMLLNHLADSGLVSLVSRLEDAKRSSNQAARLVFACDTGLAAALWPRLSDGRWENLYSLALTAIYHHCSRAGEQVWAWRLGSGFGLAVGDGAVGDGGALSRDGGVAIRLMIDLQVKEGEPDISRLKAAMATYGCKDGLLLTMGEQTKSPGVTVIPLWRWLMEKPTDMSANFKPAKTRVKKPGRSTKLPRHLL